MEMDGLIDSNTFEVVPRSSVPAGNTPIRAIWSFCHKRLPDWTILKWKACLCHHGGEQEHGVNFWETYVPVVTWSTVCLMLILSLFSGLKSLQIDYIQAYTQAPLNCDMYLKVSAGFRVHNSSLHFTEGLCANDDERDYVLRLKKSLSRVSSKPDTTGSRNYETV